MTGELTHEGSSDQLRFVAADSSRARDGLVYQSLLSYGRQVFQLCLGAVLVGIDLAEKSSLAETLVTNQERFGRVCRILDDSTVDPRETLRRIASVVSAASQYRYVSEPGLKIETMIGAARLAAKALLNVPFEMTPQVTQSLEQFVNAQKTPDHVAQLAALKLVNGQIAQASTSIPPGAEAAGFELLRLVWHYVGLYYEWTVQRGNTQAGQH